MTDKYWGLAAVINQGDYGFYITGPCTEKEAERRMWESFFPDLPFDDDNAELLNIIVSFSSDSPIE